VEGQIEEKGLCKLWIIPEEKLSMEDPISAIGEPDEEPRSAAARLKAKTLESLSRGHSR